MTNHPNRTAAAAARKRRSRAAQIAAGLAEVTVIVPAIYADEIRHIAARMVVDYDDAAYLARLPTAEADAVLAARRRAVETANA